VGTGPDKAERTGSDPYPARQEVPGHPGEAEKAGSVEGVHPVTMGYTAQSIAKKYGHGEIVELLNKSRRP